MNTDFQANLTPTLRHHFAQAVFTPISVGHSADTVLRVETDTAYYLKIGAKLKAEADRLTWLEGKLPVPRVMHFEQTPDKDYLLTEALTGVMVHEATIPYQRRVDLLAAGLRLWHMLPVDSCPFDWTLNVQIPAARKRMDAGLVDESDFDLHRLGHSAQSLFADLLSTMPDTEDCVVAHGDYCLPNILIDPSGDHLIGFVDVGRMGVSDRYLDLALALRSITYNLGGRWMEPFMRAYGQALDPARYNFYTLLDEFF